MRAVEKRRGLVVAGVVILAAFAVGLFVALGGRSVVAGPDSAPSAAPPNPGHSWSDIGDLPGTMWHSNNDGPGSGLNADTLDGLQSTDLWSTSGNSGTTPGTDFLGTTDNQALELHVNGSRALRLEPDATSPNVIGGYSGNSVTSGAVGATIGGGGYSGVANRVTDDHGSVGGGANNRAGDGAGTTSDASAATVCGGGSNTASHHYATVGGGYGNSATEYGTTIGGGDQNTVVRRWSTIGGGHINSIDAQYATVGGGLGNSIIGHYDSIGGGWYNVAASEQVTIAGGGANTANGYRSTIGGGFGNEAAGDYATIAGGGRSDPGDPATRNRVTDEYGTIGGGGDNQAGIEDGNTANQTYATVGGGESNAASATYSTVGGGRDNTASGIEATVGGGWENTASNWWATVGGGAYNTASGVNATVGGGGSNVASGEDGTVSGGFRNTISGEGVTVSGGIDNIATDDYGTVGGGWANQAGDNAGTTSDSISATVGGGEENIASATSSTVGGGEFNIASAMSSTVGGGSDNTASEWHATVGGGQSNTANGPGATVPGGANNTAYGSVSFAAGSRAKANNSGCFVWGDATGADVECNIDNRFIARASGGVYLYTNSSLTSGAYLASGSGTWSSVSDREVKENFTAVDGQEVVATLAEIPMTTWNYTTEDSSIRHMGLAAQDLYAAFGLGDDERYITTIDADGVALAAIQGLYELSQEQAERIDTLEARVTALEGGAPVKREAPAEAGSESLLSSMMPTGWLLLAGLFVVSGLVMIQLRPRGVGR